MIKHFIILLIFFSQLGVCQSSDSKNNKATIIFKEIEEGISRGNIKSISKYLSQQTYFSFSNGVNGYYSNNQAFYVMEDFLKINKVISFRFQNIQIDEGSAYATGIYIYENKGRRQQSQVYISLALTGKIWRINQITIN